MEKCQFSSESHDGVIWERARSHFTEKLCNVNLTTIFRSWHSRSTFGCSLESRLSDVGVKASYFQIFREIQFSWNFPSAGHPTKLPQTPSIPPNYVQKKKQNCIKIPWPGGVGRLWVTASSSFLTSNDISPRRMNGKRKWKLSCALGRREEVFTIN